MSIPSDLKYTTTHEWVRREENIVTVGITHFAQEQLGDVTFVELPAIGESFEAEEKIVVIESVKTAADVYAPVNGKVVEVNESLEETPEKVNEAAYSDGWLFKLETSAGDEGLLDAGAYSDIAS